MLPPPPDKRWFVLRATHNRARSGYKRLEADGIEAYLPMKTVLRTVQGRKVKSTEPLLPSLLFVYERAERLDDYLRAQSRPCFLNYYYDHFRRTDHGTNPPLTIDYDDMMNFIRLTATDSRHIRLVSPEQCRFKSGDTVRVTSGPFKDVRGRVARVAGQQRVVVVISGLCSVATAYIPSAFLEHI